PLAVILGLDPRIKGSGALMLSKRPQADNPILGSSPRMTADKRTLPPRPEQDDRGAEQADRAADEVPAVRRRLLDQRHPRQRGDDIDPAIGRERPPRRLGRDQRPQPRKGDQAEHARRQPPRRTIQLQPRPEGEAAADLGQGRQGIDEGELHSPFFAAAFSAASLASTRPRPLARAWMAPRRVATSCSVKAARPSMTRRFWLIERFFSSG